MNIRTSPVVVRCLTCAAAVDASAADTCPFCGTDVAAMPVLHPDPLDDVEPIAATAPVAVPVMTKRRRRWWPIALVLAVAVGAAFAGKDLHLSARREAVARMPQLAIPFESTTPPAPPSAAPKPSPPATAAPEVAAAVIPAPPRQGCDFFSTQAIVRQYDFARGRADLKLQRTLENNDHMYALDHDGKAHDARARAARGEHAATIAQLDRELGRARDTCDPSLLF